MHRSMNNLELDLELLMLLSSHLWTTRITSVSHRVWPVRFWISNPELAFLGEPATDRAMCPAQGEFLF